MPAAYLAAGSGILGGIFGGHKHNPITEDVIPLYVNLFQSEKEFFGKANAWQNKQLNTINEGYGAAQKNLAGGALTAKQDVLDTQQKTLAKINQNAISTGMYGSSVGANQTAQAGAMAGKNLAAIDATLAQLMSSLDIQKANAVGGVEGQMAQMAMNQAQLNMGLGNPYGSILGGTQYTNNTAGMLGLGLGGLSSILFGGGGGGGGGGSGSEASLIASIFGLAG